MKHDAIINKMEGKYVAHNVMLTKMALIFINGALFHIIGLGGEQVQDLRVKGCGLNPLWLRWSLSSWPLDTMGINFSMIIL